MNNQIFAWDNYDDNPLNGAPLTTIETAKEATYAPVGEGELVADAFETLTSNSDEYAYPQIAEVAGEKAKALIYGEGLVNVTNEEESYKFVTAAFECNSGYKAAIAYIFDKTEEDISGHTVTVKYGDDVQTLPFVNESVEAVDAELAEQMSELTGEDYSAYIGWYCGAYFDEYNYREGETYTFNLDGVEVATETGTSCE